MSVPITRLSRRLRAPVSVVAGALLLWLIGGIGFANYDTLYALSWGGQLARGELPAYDVPVAPTPHPLLELVGLVLSPLGPRAVEDITVALGFLALAGCGLVLYRLGELWFGRAAGALGALVLLTRVPIQSYAVRAYGDIPYLLLVLSAVLAACRPRSGENRPAAAPVLALLAVAGLLRPEAWVFSALYWLYMAGRLPRRGWRFAGLTLLAASAPLVWVLSDLAITGDALWSLSNTRDTARELGRVTGIGNVAQYIPRRTGEILRPSVLAGAALGGVLGLLWVRRRALPGVGAGAAALVVFAALAAAGLPINTRYAFPLAAILCIFCGAGVFGWTALQRGDLRRRWWMAGGTLVLVGLLASAPGQYHSAHRERDKLAAQLRIQHDLRALVDDDAITLRCGPVGVPSHAPIPLLALYLKTSPANIPSAQAAAIASGEYVQATSTAVERTYLLDPRDAYRPVGVPAGFTEGRGNRSWSVFQSCP